MTHADKCLKRILGIDAATKPISVSAPDNAGVGSRTTSLGTAVAGGILGVKIT